MGSQATTHTSKERLAAEVMALVSRLNKERLREGAIALRPYELTTQQLWLLGELPEEGGLPTGALAEAMRCHGSNVTGMVDRLEARGLVERHASAADRRVKYVTLTTAGHRLRQELTALAQRPPQALLERLDAGQLATLRELLARACADLG